MYACSPGFEERNAGFEGGNAGFGDGNAGFGDGNAGFDGCNADFDGSQRCVLMWDLSRPAPNISIYNLPQTAARARHATLSNNHRFSIHNNAFMPCSHVLTLFAYLPFA